ncbi:MAG: carbon storage regulator CsrA [Pirellulaceae bacterium]
MLVVSRSKGESLMIGDDIEVQVVEIRGDKIRLGVTCPADTSVHRREVLDAIQRLNQESSAPPQNPEP